MVFASRVLKASTKMLQMMQSVTNAQVNRLLQQQGPTVQVIVPVSLVVCQLLVTSTGNGVCH